MFLTRRVSWGIIASAVKTFVVFAPYRIKEVMLMDSSNQPMGVAEETNR